MPEIEDVQSSGHTNSLSRTLNSNVERLESWNTRGRFVNFHKPRELSPTASCGFFSKLLELLKFLAPAGPTEAIIAGENLSNECQNEAIKSKCFLIADDNIISICQQTNYEEIKKKRHFDNWKSVLQTDFTLSFIFYRLKNCSQNLSA